MAHARKATLEDARYLAGCLRSADLVELEALGKRPMEALESGIERSWPPCRAIVAEDREPVAMCGTVPFGSGYASIWLLGSEGLTKGQTLRDFVRYSPNYIQSMHLFFPIMGNAVHVDNIVHQRWLSRLGFKFFPRRGMFIPFERRYPCADPLPSQALA
jgi:hypothetical protein